MPKITFIEHRGTRYQIDAEEGLSLMEVAVSNSIPGIDGDCGGFCACATCHVHVESEWLDKLPAMEDLERAMLEVAPEFNKTSRLACQIPITTELDGLVVHTPLGQH